MILTNSSPKFTQALQLAQQGNTKQSFKIFSELTAKQSNDYCTMVNYGVLCIQQAMLKEAREAFRKAIDIDCYQYLAYYNLFIAGCHDLGRGGVTSKETYQQRRDNLCNLYFTLSCLYAELGQLEQDIKICTKALYYSEQNSMAYVNRAALYQRDNKPKLAQNDYSSAIYYDPQNMSLYMKRAQFYWKQNNIQQSNNDLKTYWQKRTTSSLQSTPSLPSLPSYPKHLKCPQITQIEIAEYDSIIEQKCLQLHNLLMRVSAANQRKEENWVFRIPASPRCFDKVANLEKVINFQHLEDVEDMDSLCKGSSQNSSLQGNQYDHYDAKVINKQQKLADMSEDGYADESSKNISQQIQKLQKQIRLQRGKVSQSQSSQQPSQHNLKEQTFLTAEIEKTSKQIQNIKNKEMSDVKSASSFNSCYEEKLLTLDQLRSYGRIVLEIVSAQFFDSNKQESKVYISYGKQRAQTEYSKTLIWRQKVQFNIEHNLHKNFKSALESSSQLDHDDFTRNAEGDIVLQLEIKSNTFWRSKKIIGRGSINIMMTGENKCILSNQKQKTGIVYFKLKVL